MLIELTYDQLQKTIHEYLTVYCVQDGQTKGTIRGKEELFTRLLNFLNGKPFNLENVRAFQAYLHERNWKKDSSKDCLARKLRTLVNYCYEQELFEKNWAGRHPILTGLFVLIIFIIVISVISSSGKGGSGSSSSDNNSGSSAQAAQTKTAKVGDIVNDGDLGFTVQSVDNEQTIGNSFSQKTAQGTYYILTVKIQNNGKDTKTINASDFTVVDSQGRTYDYSQDGQTAMEETDGSTSFFLQQIQPSLSVTGKLVFDVPKTATGLKLMAQGDIFSSPVSIDLGK